ncbi:MAG: hypothetical protein AAFZ65_07770, partial [Planctomycetota bacterium]
DGAVEWIEVLETSDVRLFQERFSAFTGVLGLGTELGPGEVLDARSPAVTVRAGQALAALASLRGELPAAIGLELFSADGARSATVWSTSSAGDAEAWNDFEVRNEVRPGFDRARLRIVAGPFEGDDELRSLSMDDLGLVPTDDAVAVVHEDGTFKLELSEPGRQDLLLYQAFEPLLSARVSRGASAASPRAALELETQAQPARVRVDGGGLLRVHARSALVGDDARAVATQGQDGFRERAGAFDAEGVDALLLGVGRTQMRLVFERPVSLVASAVEDGLAFEVDLAGATGFAVQTDFTAELSSAVELATRARGAESEGRLGDALDAWNQLRTRYPFEEQYLAEAETSRARLLADGLERLRELEVELERARFFALPGVYSRCEEVAAGLVARFAPTDPEAASTEVADRASALLAAIREERSQLAGDASALEPLRRDRILDWLERNDASELAERLRADG